MKTALVCGAGGFIGGHLAKRLKAEGCYVRGADVQWSQFARRNCNESLTVDLRDLSNCEEVVRIHDRPADEVYNLAADMGGMGYIHSAECDIMRNSALININMVHAAAAAAVGRYFFSSSVCVYRDMAIGEPELHEVDAVPAEPDNEYGWEKLYAERMALAYSRRYGLPVRIARFQNCYGPEGAWQGGREKAPAAICRKVAEAVDDGTIEVWGDGTAVRSYTYVDDMIDGIHRLTHSELEGPTNVGSSEYVSVLELVETVMSVAGKKLEITWVDGPVGVRSRNFSHARIESLGWQTRRSLRAGIEMTYPWIEKQVRAARTPTTELQPAGSHL